MEIDDELFFGLVKEPTFEIGTEVISPAETTALAATKKSSELRNNPPTTLAISEDEVDELPVFLHRPRPFLHSKLVAAGFPTHVGYNCRRLVDGSSITSIYI